jgi:hypothetical protein
MTLARSALGNIWSHEEKSDVLAQDDHQQGIKLRHVNRRRSARMTARFCNQVGSAPALKIPDSAPADITANSREHVLAFVDRQLSSGQTSPAAARGVSVE